MLFERQRLLLALLDAMAEPVAHTDCRRHPYYATRSEIVERVLSGSGDRARVAAARPARLKPGLVTIGYEGKALERYLNQLLREV
jgi:hypothetical protein